MSDLFFPVEYLGDGQRGLDGPKSIPRFSWYISTYDVGGPPLGLGFVMKQAGTQLKNKKVSATARPQIQLWQKKGLTLII